MAEDQYVQETVSWDNCPTDVILKIFEMLPMPSLAVCMFVNKTWRNHVEYMLRVKNRWKKFVGTVTNHSELWHSNASSDWQQILYNYILWHNIEKATMSLQHVENINKIKKIRLYKDHLIVIMADIVQYYDAMTFTKQKTVDLACKDFCENDDMIIVVTENDIFFKLEIYKKPASNIFEMDTNHMCKCDSVLCYKFHDNHCYLLNDQNSLYVCSTANDHLKLFFKARFYANPQPKSRMSINVINEQVYLLYKDGLMLWLDANRRHFTKMLSFRTPFQKTGQMNRKIFDWYTMETNDNTGNNQPEAENLNSKHRKISHIEGYWRLDSSNETVVFVYHVTNVSCMLQHCDLLVLAQHDGTVEIINPQDRYSEKPMQCFSIKDLLDNTTDLRIVCIEVSAKDNQHFMYVATSTQIYQMCFKYGNFEDYIWRDKVCEESILSRFI